MIIIIDTRLTKDGQEIEYRAVVQGQIAGPWQSSEAEAKADGRAMRRELREDAKREPTS